MLILDNLPHPFHDIVVLHPAMRCKAPEHSCPLLRLALGAPEPAPMPVSTHHLRDAGAVGDLRLLGIGHASVVTSLAPCGKMPCASRS